MVSGYLLIGSSSSTNYKLFIKRRLNKTLIPILFWNAVYYIYSYYISKNGSVSDFVYQLWHSGTQHHLYFLNLILGLYIITPFLSTFIHRKYLALHVLLFVCLGSVYSFGYSFLGFPLLNNIFVLFIPYIGYYLAGYWIRNCKHIKQSNILSIVALILFMVSVIVSRKLLFIYNTNDQGTILVNRLSLPVALFSMAIFYQLVKISNRTLQKYSLLEQLSSLTFGVYLIHPLYLILLQSLPISNFAIANYYWTWFISLFLATTTLSFVSVFLFKKLPILNRIV